MHTYTRKHTHTHTHTHTHMHTHMHTHARTHNLNIILYSIYGTVLVLQYLAMMTLFICRSLCRAIVYIPFKLYTYMRGVCSVSALVSLYSMYYT